MSLGSWKGPLPAFLAHLVAGTHVSLSTGWRRAYILSAGTTMLTGGGDILPQS